MESRGSLPVKRPPLWPECRSESAGDPYKGLSEKDAWLLAYAGWYHHFLSGQETQSRLMEGWAHQMVEATLSTSWYGVAYWMPDTKRSKGLREEYLSLRRSFERNSKDLLARVAQWQAPQDVDPDPAIPAETITMTQGQTAHTDSRKDEQLDLFG